MIEYSYPSISTLEILKKTYLLDLGIALGLGWKAMVGFQHRKIFLYEGCLSKLDNTPVVVI